MSISYAAIVGGILGGLASLVIVIGFVCFYMFQSKNFSNKNSDTGSSDPSALVEWNRGGGPSSAGVPHLSGPQGARQFTLEELEQATKQFSKNKLIGGGSFGLVYKGLLHDGTVVVKRRPAAPRQEFVEEVCSLSGIWHRHLVTLIGYCQENSSQMLVFEYLPNGSVRDHLYGTGQNSITQLEFKQRLSIALGAAKGLCHLHSLVPPLVHRNFKTANVLVDENFIAKVADAGISRLLEIIEDAGPSSRATGENIFQDPEVGRSGTFSEMSDVYSFGVFLLELITGREVSKINFLGSGESLFQWVETHVSANNLVDHRLASSLTSEGMRDLIRLALGCISLIGKRRPNMAMIVSELDRILEKEMARTTGMGEGTATVTLGSQLFTSG